MGRSLQRKGHDHSFVDPRYPDSMQAVPGNRELATFPPATPPTEVRLKGAVSQRFSASQPDGK
jgi:hypothetical protein